ncbi:sensor histidine kinase [Chitinophaga eiseniae]|uniref:Histidine kinase n=1 Tax=Chitinophaga eiseniae TaxID=634771 RepID=A0A847SKB4_9BACT|nr:histidine kinase [Chitinophaga eiseniae]NLR80584.1 histidine kinase [Chitinophaga eiseniae]
MIISKYSRVEPWIISCFILPYTILINLLIFGTGILYSANAFFTYLGSSLLLAALSYGLFGIVATVVKQRFPGDHELFSRIGILLPVFYIMNLLTVQGYYLVYGKLYLASYPPRQWMQWWVTGYGCLASSILTFLNEAASGWEKWRTAMAETGRLQSAYQKSRLLSLRRQLHPHFLFNCFNSLSSLIHENEKEAGKFLDELTKVYRYLLKGKEERWVSLEEELKFIHAYLFLVNTRFGMAFNIHIDIPAEDATKQVAPMSLLVVLENIIYRNAFSRTNPIFVWMYTQKGQQLVIENTLQPKVFAGDHVDYEEGLDELVNKYRLLGPPEIVIQETGIRRLLVIPLIENEWSS